MASLENAFTDLTDFFSAIFGIFKAKFTRKKILEKSTGKVGNLDVKNTIVVKSV